MSLAIKSFAVATLLASLLLTAHAAGQKPITVRDIIETTRVAGSPYFAYRPKSGFAVFSPDKKKFVIVLARGNVRKDTNDYSLLLFRTSRVFAGAAPKIIARIASASNHLGIFDPEWSRDNNTIYFLGTVGKAPTELYSLDCTSGRITQLTHHETALLAYGVSSDRRTIVYEAEAKPESLLTPAALQHGLRVGSEELSDLIRGTTGGEPRLFVERNGTAAQALHTSGDVRPGYGLSLSPNGRYLALQTDVMNVPAVWSQYQDPGLQSAFRRGFPKGLPSGIMQYEVIDTQTGRSERPLDSPAGYCSSLLWSPDSESLLVCGVYLPLNVRDPQELVARKSTKFMVEVDLPVRKFIKVADGNVYPLDWNTRTGILELETWQVSRGERALPAMLLYQKAGNQWKRIAGDAETMFPSAPDIVVDGDLNEPPVIVAVNPRTGQHVKLLDLNPKISAFELGKVETVNWKDGLGRSTSGALYLPPGYVAGRRYPLVIQTHGFDPHGFWLDGPYSSGFAAQVLADRGIAVLQMNDLIDDQLVTRNEGLTVMKTYENAVGQLYDDGIIDRDRVGLLGFSRTCYYVEYTLTHSDHRFAAAAVVDGIDAGYLQYLIAAVARPHTASEFDVMNGSPPFGEGLREWFNSSPGFLLDKIRTPLLVEAFGPLSVLDEWQTFAGLRRLGKPVDLLYLPEATHVPVRPSDRQASQGAVADWFYFWLRGKEDPNPAKREEYRSWSQGVNR